MVHKGWFRLWVVATLIAVPTIAWKDFSQKEQFWGNLASFASHVCVNQETEFPNHPDAIECARNVGAFKTMFEREGTTPIAYWSHTLGYAFLLDFGATGVLFVVYLIASWVKRGFQISN